jgi:phospholipid/cholesterol/gamma-HCH transport system permease protein
VKPTPIGEYFRSLLAALQARDVASTLVKGLVFGIIVSVVATFQGFKVKVAVTEIPRAAIKAVGQGFVLVFVADAIITLITYV